MPAKENAQVDRRWIFPILVLFALLFGLGGAGSIGVSAGSASATASAPAHAGPILGGGQHGERGEPLEKLLNEDGTLDLGAGFSGSVDPSGWQMKTRPGGEPRFVRAGMYLYRFAPPGDPSGAWWSRTRTGEWLPALSADDPRLVRFLEHYGWLDRNNP